MGKFDDWTVGDPLDPGWYATLTCWDPQEGYFPGANLWDGTGWNGHGPIVFRSDKTFPTETEAAAWADAHDPEC